MFLNRFSIGRLPFFAAASHQNATAGASNIMTPEESERLSGGLLASAGPSFVESPVAPTTPHAEPEEDEAAYGDASLLGRTDIPAFRLR